METKLVFDDGNKKVFKFLPYLWGMETILKELPSLLNVGFLPYLWGMETRPRVEITQGKILGSYRTYEEWKLDHEWK